MVFMTYANVVYSYGTERFCQKCAEVGMDGMILPDVPYEEKEDFDPICKKYGLDLISLIAPTSENRISMIAKEASGFIYIVSSLGVTGVRSEITTDIGAIVGSAIICLLEKYKTEAAGPVGEYVKPMKDAIRDLCFDVLRMKK